MILSKNALQKYVDINSLNWKNFIREFSYKIAEVENSTNTTLDYSHIQVGKILSIETHPRSDKLTIVKVDIGKCTRQVCAGTKNIKVGDKVPYLNPGYSTPINPYPEKEHKIIKKKFLGGIESNGMLLSERELGVGKDHSKILVLDKSLTVGQCLNEIMELNDVTWEVENKAFTHRPDCFGIIGIAREISAAFDIELELPNWHKNPTKFQVSNTVGNLRITVYNKDNEIKINRYTAVQMKNITISSSPLWLKYFLHKHNIQSVNNVVDISNYVMLITGQPIHIFDRSKMDAKIEVRPARKDEKILALNGKVYSLDDETTVIADQRGPVALAGAIGGYDSSIDSKTKEIVIESANFDMYNIRRTSMKYGIFTEAITRFSKGVDPELTPIALNLAINMLKKYTKAKTSSDFYDYYPYPRKGSEFKTKYSYIYERSGISPRLLSHKNMIQFLYRLGLEPIAGKVSFTVKVPTHRYDIKGPEDILEEVTRMYGYNKIHPTLPCQVTSPVIKPKALRVKDLVRQSLKELGGNELITYSFVGKELYKSCNLNAKELLHIQNYLSPELEFFRSSLIPSLLEKMQQNIKSNEIINEGLFFETGKTYLRNDYDSTNLPTEYFKTSFVYTNKMVNTHDSGYYQGSFVFYEVCKAIGNITISKKLYNPNTKYPKWIANILPMFNLNQTGMFYTIDKHANNKKLILGVVGTINPQVRKNFGLPIYSCIGEFIFDRIPDYMIAENRYKPLSIYQPIIQDMCFVVDLDTNVEAIKNAILNCKSAKNILSIKLIDIFADFDNPILKSNQIQKQVTYRINFGNNEEQLQSSDIDTIRSSIIRNVGIKVRGTLKTQHGTRTR